MWGSHVGGSCKCVADPCGNDQPRRGNRRFKSSRPDHNYQSSPIPGSVPPLSLADALGWSLTFPVPSTSMRSMSASSASSFRPSGFSAGLESVDSLCAETVMARHRWLPRGHCSPQGVGNRCAEQLDCPGRRRLPDCSRALRNLAWRSFPRDARGSRPRCSNSKWWNASSIRKRDGRRQLRRNWEAMPAKKVPIDRRRVLAMPRRRPLNWRNASRSAIDGSRRPDVDVTIPRLLSRARPGNGTRHSESATRCQAARVTATSEEEYAKTRFRRPDGPCPARNARYFLPPRIGSSAWPTIGKPLVGAPKIVRILGRFRK